MTVSEKRKKQWKLASRRRKEKIQRLKQSTPKKYSQVRVGLSRSNRKTYSKKANAGSDSTKLARYHRLLNKFDKNRQLIKYKMDRTRNRSLKIALEKSKRNAHDSKALEILADLSNIQKNNFLLYDKNFEELHVQIDGQDFSVQVSKLIKENKDGEVITYRLPFAGQGYNRSVLLVSIEAKCIYYWGKKTITHPDINMINIRKEPRNCEKDWGTITLMKYFEENNFFEFTDGRNYSLQNFGLWHAIRRKIRDSCDLRDNKLQAQTIRAYDTYDHDFLVDRGTYVNCTCQRCQERGLI